MRVRGIKTDKSSKQKLIKLILILLLLIIFQQATTNLIQVNAINCITQYGDCPQEILNEINSVTTTKYFSKKKQVDKLLRQNILVNEFSLQYQLPGELRVTLNVKVPRYALFDKSKNKFLLVDKNGIVLYESGQTKLPNVSINSTLSVKGEKVNKEELFALQIIERVSILASIRNGEINLEKNELIVTLADDKLVKFPLNGDVEILAGSLSAIFSRLNDHREAIKMGNIKEIDLRFKNVVLR